METPPKATRRQIPVQLHAAEIEKIDKAACELGVSRHALMIASMFAGIEAFASNPSLLEVHLPTVRRARREK